MTLIRVEPGSVRAYGAQAQQLFDAMHHSLVALVDEVVGVRYYGPNAVAFKSECGRLAAEFANELHVDMTAMADAVRQSTSNIAAALGGAPIHLGLDARPISPPAPEVVEYVDVDTAALDALTTVVRARFGDLRQHLTSHLQRLEATDWQGNAKLRVVDAVGSYTAAARSRCEAAEQLLTDYIRRQTDAVLAADR